MEPIAGLLWASLLASGAIASAPPGIEPGNCRRAGVEAQRLLSEIDASPESFDDVPETRRNLRAAIAFAAGVRRAAALAARSMSSGQESAPEAPADGQEAEAKRRAGYSKETLDSWDRATHSRVEDSIEYHYKRHGSGQGIERFTKEGREFFRDHRARARPHRLYDGRMGLKIKADGRFGIYTEEGKIVTYGTR